MRFLCLHGGGTNSRLFEMQTAALRSELGPDFTFEFVEGSVVTPREKALRVLGQSFDTLSFLPQDEEFWAYYDPDAADAAAQLASALEDLRDFVLEEGPFDGVLAFSQACAVAASYILRYQTNGRFADWKVCVFVAGEPGELLDSSSRGMRIATEPLLSLPTVHCTGSADKVNPESHRVLARQCQSKKRVTYVHLGGHEVPSRREDVVKLSNLIRRACQVW